jgi:hypothetical protein
VQVTITPLRTQTPRPDDIETVPGIGYRIAGPNHFTQFMTSWITESQANTEPVILHCHNQAGSATIRRHMVGAIS